MTFTVPYAVVTRIIWSSCVGISAADCLLFEQGIKTTYLWLAAINTVAILPSFLRGRGANRAAAPAITPVEP
jgi:hypothetical protein